MLSVSGQRFRCRAQLPKTAIIGSACLVVLRCRVMWDRDMHFTQISSKSLPCHAQPLHSCHSHDVVRTLFQSVRYVLCSLPVGSSQVTYLCGIHQTGGALSSLAHNLSLLPTADDRRDSSFVLVHPEWHLFPSLDVVVREPANRSPHASPLSWGARAWQLSALYVWLPVVILLVSAYTVSSLA